MRYPWLANFDGPDSAHYFPLRHMAVAGFLFVTERMLFFSVPNPQPSVILADRTKPAIGGTRSSFCSARSLSLDFEFDSIFAKEGSSFFLDPCNTKRILSEVVQSFPSSRGLFAAMDDQFHRLAFQLLPHIFGPSYCSSRLDSFYFEFPCPPKRRGSGLDQIAT
jgi:hypothetical protein